MQQTERIGDSGEDRPGRARCVSIWYMIVQKARSPSASRPWPPPAAARPGLMAPRSASCVQAYIVHTTQTVTQPVGCVRALGEA